MRATFALGAAAAAIGHCGTLAAQGMQATPSVVRGSAVIATDTSLTRIVSQSRQVVIDWTPTGSGSGSDPAAPYDFLPIGRTARFTGTGEASNGFTVLNRLLSSRPAGLNGTIESILVNSPIGEIWFYSPNGIFVGPRALVRVGSLVMTTSAIDTTGGLYGGNGEIRFIGTPNPGAGITVVPGAGLSARGSNAYLALVSPRIEQGGNIGASRSVALVAAEQADLRINAGLIDITVRQGTADANGIVHTGNIGGPSFGTPTAISIVAIPKNQAMTMLLSGNFGYRAAAGASIDGNAIVLTAGTEDRPASIAIGDALFASPVLASASKAIDIAPTDGGVAGFNAAADLRAGESISLTANAGAVIQASGRLALTAGNSVTLAANGSNGDRGEIRIAGPLDIRSGEVAASGAGQGGLVTLAAGGGTISAGQVAIDASGRGLAGRQGTGGTVSISASDDGLLRTAELAAEADGIGGSGAQAAGGLGGGIAIADRGGTLDFGLVDLSANAIAAGSADSAGGSVSIDIQSRPQSWGGLSASANATGPTGSLGQLVAGRIAVSASGSGALAIDGAFTGTARGTVVPSGSAIAISGPIGIGGAALLDAAGAIELGRNPASAIAVSGPLTIITPATVSSLGLLQAAGEARIKATQGIALDRVTAGGPMILSAIGGPVTVGALRSSQALTVDGETIKIDGIGDLAFEEILATAGQAAVRTDGNLALGSINASGAIAMTAGGDIATSDIRGASVTLSAGTNVTISGPVVSQSSLEIAAGEATMVNDLLGAATVQIRAGDLDIAAGGRVGLRGTTRSVSLTSIRTDGTAAIGGDDSTAFSLSNAEFGRIFAGDALTIAAASDLTIGNLDVSFGANGNLAAGGSLALRSAGRVTVGGMVRAASSGVADELRVDGRTIAIDITRGGFSVANAQGVPQGRLLLAAERVIAAIGDALSLLADAADPVTIAEILDRPAATSAFDYLTAATIGMEVADRLLLQNSGTSLDRAARRGFLAESLSIDTGQPGALVVVNGRARTSNGGFLVGDDTAQAVSINGSGGATAAGLDARSSINGCLIGQRCVVIEPGPRELVPGVPPPRSGLDTVIDIERTLDGTRRLDIDEKLSRIDRISRLDRNDTLPPSDIDHELQPGRAPLSGDRDREREREQAPTPDRTASNAIDYVQIPRSFSVIPFLVVLEELDRATLKPLTDEPITGIGNDDLWLGQCGATPQDPCETPSPD